MKPKIRYWNGYWWCRRMGITGQGLTMEQAYKDMWDLYREFIVESRPKSPCRPVRA
jgi:hypothetical protein